MFDLLRDLDTLHREALRRIIAVIETNAPHLLSHLASDSIIETLLLLYEFLPQPTLPARPHPSSDHSFIPLSQIKLSSSTKQPVWIPAGSKTDFSAGELVGKNLEGENVVLCLVEGQFYAIQNACLDSILPLSVGKLEGHFVICPWHGCRYDVRSGEIQNDSGLKLKTFPVQIDERGTIRVGSNVAEWR